MRTFACRPGLHGLFRRRRESLNLRVCVSLSPLLTSYVSSPGQGLAQRQEVKTDIFPRIREVALSFFPPPSRFECGCSFGTFVFVLSPPVLPDLSRVLHERSCQVRLDGWRRGTEFFLFVQLAGFFCFTVLLQSHIEFRPCTTVFTLPILCGLGGTKSHISAAIAACLLRGLIVTHCRHPEGRRPLKPVVTTANPSLDRAATEP